MFLGSGKRHSVHFAIFACAQVWQSGIIPRQKSYSPQQLVTSLVLQIQRKSTTASRGTPSVFFPKQVGVARNTPNEHSVENISDMSRCRVASGDVESNCPSRTLSQGECGNRCSFTKGSYLLPESMFIENRVPCLGKLLTETQSYEGKKRGIFCW